jgi:transcription elongation factor GreA
MSSIEQARRFIADGAYDKLDDIWTDLITNTDIELHQYFDIANALKATGESARACLLLEILSDQYETQHEYRKAIEVQKTLLRFHEESPQIRKKILELYRKQHAASEHYDDYLELSGLSKDEPIMKAIHKLEEYLDYDIGRAFYFERYGMGKVVDVIPERREIVIDFEKKHKHFLTLDVARGVLSPINEQHFLHIKHENIEDLRSLISTQPQEIVVVLLRSFGQPMPASKIKGYLEGIVEKKELNRFWEKVRKILETHDNIRVQGTTSKTYAYVESAADKIHEAIDAFHKARPRDKYKLAEEYFRKMPSAFDSLASRLVQIGNGAKKEHPGLALDIFMLFQEIGWQAGLDYSIDDLIQLHPPEKILREMTNHQHQTSFISIIKARYPDKWSNIATDIIFDNDDFRVLDEVIDNLNDMPDRQQDIYHRILATAKQHPKQFHWMLRRIETGALDDYLKPAFIPRLINSLDYVHGVKATVRKILTLDNFDAVVAIAENAEAQRIRDAVKNSVVLTEHEKNGYVRILEHHFPALTEKKTDIIFSTEAALNRRRAELEHLLTVQIPANKQEISRARDFGDLSENFEYKAAKERQDQLYERVKIIESELIKTQIIESTKITTDSVSIGTAIKLKNLEDDSIATYKILGRWDTDLPNRVISNEAPLAQSMLGKKCGDRVKIEGTEYLIVEINKAL